MTVVEEDVAEIDDIAMTLELTHSPLQAGFKTPPAVRNTQITIEKCVSPVDFKARFKTAPFSFR